MNELDIKYTQYIQSYEGIALLKKYSLQETGVWEILGEDPNCDFGGYHLKPRIGFAEGKLEDVIQFAITCCPNFYTWGSGGTIKKMEPPTKVDKGAAARRRAQLAKITTLEKQLEEAKAQLKEI